MQNGNVYLYKSIIDMFAKIKNALSSQRVFYRYYRRKGWKRFVKENILETNAPNYIKAQSIALGLFIGFSPFWGLHTFLVVFLASTLKLNKMLSFIASQIAFPPLVPFIIYGSIVTGRQFIGGENPVALNDVGIEDIKRNVLQYLVGGMLWATVISLIGGLVSYVLLTRLQPENKAIRNK